MLPPPPPPPLQNGDVVKPRALKTFIDGLEELGINKRLMQNKRILAELLEKEQSYRDKDSDAGDEEILSESSDNEDGTETASEYSEHQESESPDLKPEGNSDVPYTEKKPQVQRFCLKERSLLLLQRRERLRKISSQMP